MNPRNVPGTLGVARVTRIIKALGGKATTFIRKMIDKKQIRLEYDRTNAHMSRSDKCDRILAYFYLNEGPF